MWCRRESGSANTFNNIAFYTKLLDLMSKNNECNNGINVFNSNFRTAQKLPEINSFRKCSVTSQNW